MRKTCMAGRHRFQTPILAGRMASIVLPWNGLLNWQALGAFRTVLARRRGGGWLIGLGNRPGIAAEPWCGGRPCFGYAAYDLKNEFERLSSRHPAGDGFARSAWWEPQFTVHLAEGRAELHGVQRDMAAGKRVLEAFLAAPGPVAPPAPALWERTTPKARYLERVGQLLAHIRRGDIYEVNYCTRRTAHLPGFDPYRAFARLLAHTDAPHAALLRHGGHFALCASPERFFSLAQGRITTQPMKGTRPRGKDGAADRALADELAADPKERSENIMALDVARNDLSRIAAPASVRVDELCAVKTFRTVHQMISTASAALRPGTTPMGILRATFPMASMTGAPKVRAMELIDQAEDMRRGLFSGTIGYFLPDGTADLNVVIRTITWDAATGQAALISGGAITAASDPLQEYEECEHKARSVLNAFGHAC